MIDALPPLTRRIIALGLFVLLLFGAITQILVPLIDANRSALRDLSDIREARARAEAIRAAPEPRPVMAFPARVGLRGADARSAAERLVGHVTTTAARSGLQLMSGQAPVAHASAPALINARISVTGPRDVLMNWMSRLERGSPAVRFRDWQLSDMGHAIAPPPPPPAVPNATPPPSLTQERLLRLDASIVALWVGAS